MLDFYRGVRDRELALVGVALKVASPTEDDATAAGVAIGAIRRLCEQVGQRPTLRSLGFDERVLDIVAEDAIADAAIRNSPRLPTPAQARSILAVRPGLSIRSIRGGAATAHLICYGAVVSRDASMLGGRTRPLRRSRVRLRPTDRIHRSTAGPLGQAIRLADLRHRAPRAREPPSGPMAGWRTSMACWIAMDARHPDLFHDTPRAEIERAIDELKGRAATATDDELMVGVARIVALVSASGRDAHTGLFPWSPDSKYPVHSLPLRLWLFPDGLRVVDALAPNEDLIGARIDTIADHPVDDVLAALDPMIPVTTTRRSAS